MDDYISPDFGKAALLTIDVQHDFVLPGTAMEIPGTAEILLKIRELVRGFRGQAKPVIHVVRLYLPDGSNADLYRRRIIESGKQLVIPGSDGAEPVEALKPSSDTRLDAERLLNGEFQAIGPMEWVMYKPRWGAFFKTPLETYLRGMGINTVVVVGYSFPNCVRATVYEASERDFRIVLAHDAVSQVYERGLTELRNIGVSLLSVAEVLSRIAAPGLWMRGLCRRG